MIGKSMVVLTLAGVVMALHSVAEELDKPSTWPASHEPFKVLVFSKTAGFRHDSIPDGITAIQQLGRNFGFDVVATEDSSVFNPGDLSKFKVVLFLSTTGDVLDETQQKSFEQYIQAGGGFAGIHAASDTEYGWPWYGRLVGAYFKCHPTPQDADVHVEIHDAPSTVMLPACWRRFDEWYDFHAQPVGVDVLATVDEASYTGATFGNPHPVVWQHTYDGGRAWYTAMGHTKESFHEPLFLQHILGGIQYAAGLAPD